MDELTIVAISSAVGGLTGKFVEKAWDSGEKWIQNFYNNHNENVNKKAKENSLKFLNELALRIDKLEQNEKLTKEKINDSQNHPEFSALLEKAIMSSAQTDSKEKHTILARIVSERLKANPESVLALNSKMAVDIIPFLTVNQMKILGLLVNLYKIRPSKYPLNQVYNKSSYQLWVDGYLTHQLKPFQNLNISLINITHLESLSCIRFNKFSFSKKAEFNP
ncbi:LPO_1073/Vpar_1526 family protein [Psychroflexus halocasei]|uniref:Uncharacterized protein n=1 Tax=Psychroflexus halocasei TaxID=908615 RepID=A0A1H4E2K6_9FLAO|nr:LPO_1073/Vpar_1526 family protein [Psychroflexus halocasei]SEA79057.1 hypothetical protein SAMN05421540_1247 [Psychroflexus halocasei]